MGRARNTYGIENWCIQDFGGEIWEKEPLGRPKRKWEKHIKKSGMGSMTHDREKWRAVVNAVMKLHVPYNAGNFLTNWRPRSFSGRTVLHVVSDFIEWVVTDRENSALLSAIHQAAQTLKFLQMSETLTTHYKNFIHRNLSNKKANRKHWAFEQDFQYFSFSCSLIRFLQQTALTSRSSLPPSCGWNYLTWKSKDQDKCKCSTDMTTCNTYECWKIP
jgi:hypothetical protein